MYLKCKYNEYVVKFKLFNGEIKKELTLNNQNNPSYFWLLQNLPTLDSIFEKVADGSLDFEYGNADGNDWILFEQTLRDGTKFKSKYNDNADITTMEEVMEWLSNYLNIKIDVERL